MLRISWVAKMVNERLMEIAGVGRELMKSNGDCWYRKRVNEE